MGSTLAAAGPMVGGAAQGFVQGRQLGTQEAQSRQEMALRAAQEGRAKEEHRLSIQQLGLAIQGELQRQKQQEQMFPKQMENMDYTLRGAKGRTVDPQYAEGLQLPPGLEGLTAGEAENIAAERERARRAAIISSQQEARSDDAMARLKVQQTVMSKRAAWERAAIAEDRAREALQKAMQEFPPVEGEADEPAVVNARAALQRAAREKRRLKADHNAYISQFPEETGMEVIPEEEDELEVPELFK